MNAPPKHQAFVLPAVLAVSFVLRVLVLARARIIEHDGAMYAWLAERLLSGDRAHAMSPMWPPLFPFAIAGFALPLAWLHVRITPEVLETCARGVAAVAGTLLLVPLHRLARRLMDERAAMMTIVLAALHPRLVQYSASALTEMPFALLLVTGLALLTGVEDDARPVAREAAAGATFGLAWLARPEGAALAGLAWLASVVGRRGAARRRGLVFPLAFVVVALPYLMFLDARLGHVSLGEKGAYNFWRAYRTEYAGLYPEPAGLSESAFESPGIAPLPVPVHAAAFALRRPGVVLGRSALNLGRILVDSLPAAVYYPWFVLVLLGIPLLGSPRARPLAVSLIAFPLLYAPFSSDRRFFVPAVPLLLVLAPAGVARAERWLGERAPHARAAPRAYALILTVIAEFYVFAHPLSEEAPEHRAAGTWLATGWPAIAARESAGTAAADAAIHRPIVMSRKPWVAYYAGGELAELPEGGIDSVLARARAKHADVLVVDERWAVPHRPELAALLDPRAAPAGLDTLRVIERPERLVLYDLRALTRR